MNVDQTIVTAIIAAMAVVLVQGFAKKFFDRGSIVNLTDCEKVRSECILNRTKELDLIRKQLAQGERLFRRLEIASRIQSMALLELCKEKGLNKSIIKLEDLLEGREEWEE